MNLNYKGNKFSWNAIITLSSPLANALTESHVANDKQPVGKLASTICSGTHLQVNMIQCMAAQGLPPRYGTRGNQLHHCCPP